MPFYEYACQACGAHHEAMQKMSDAPLKKYPECGRQRLVRLISAPVFRLKGGGWYETDFKSDKEQKRNLHGEDKPAGGGADTSDSKAATPAKGTEKAEAKPAAAPAAGKRPARKAPAARKPKAAAKPRRR